MRVFPAAPVVVLPNTSPGPPGGLRGGGRSLLQQGPEQRSSTPGLSMIATVSVRDLSARGQPASSASLAASFDFSPLNGAILRLGSSPGGSSPYQGRLQELRLLDGPRSEGQLGIDARREVGCGDSAASAIWPLAEGLGEVSADKCGEADAFAWRAEGKGVADYNPVVSWANQILRLCPGETGLSELHCCSPFPSQCFPTATP